ncbi:MAG TPA: riboflavin biosynthesis protein RibF [Candidatus Limnocylindria bacterium]|jgi:riboflavin kinase/FMN adenylyltransferase|nr:riboflavin biosynthesis protein RibF [Candidatus Limnocylindria bacterium]
MVIAKHPSELPRPARGLCFAMGMFDGVHLGHQHVIRSAQLDAATYGARTTVITFDPHPLAVVNPERAPLLLQTLDQRLRAIASLGADAVLVNQFTPEFAARTGEQFIRELQDKAGPIRSFSVGHGFHFGFQRSGNVPLLRSLGAELGFTTNACAPVFIGEERVSSSLVRQGLRAGNLKQVAEFLGRPYSFAGVVQRGDQLGRQLGFPTANLDVRGLELPPFGVYAARVHLGQRTLPGVLNLGIRPTIRNDRELRFEVHLIDFNEDLYGQEIEVVFVAKLRDEKKFSGPEALKAQIAKDVGAARSLLS